MGATQQQPPLPRVCSCLLAVIKGRDTIKATQAQKEEAGAGVGSRLGAVPKTGLGPLVVRPHFPRWAGIPHFPREVSPLAGHWQ